MEVSPTDTSRRGWCALDWKLLALLAVLVIGIRGWQLTHTEVAARDSIGFVRIAWQLRESPLPKWPDVINKAEQHPLYPISIVAVSRIVEPIYRGHPADMMRLSAQLASALAALLLVVPVYLLGRDLFDRRVGFWSSLLLQMLPVSGCILADGMSEALFLMLASSSLLWGVRALRPTGGPGSFALCGFFGAMAYVTRPEGAFIVAATGIMLLIGQAVSGWRRSRRAVLVCGTALSCAALAVAGPFIHITGRLTVKPSALRVTEDSPPAAKKGSGPFCRNGPEGASHKRVPTPFSPPDASPGQEEAANVTSGPLFAVWWVYDSTPAERSWKGVGAVFGQIAKGSFYAGWAFALYGLWVHRRRTKSEPGAWMMLLVCLGIGCVLWRVVVVVGYLSDRHTLLILLCGIPWAVAGMIALAEEVARLFPRIAFASPVRRAAVIPLVFALAAVPKVFDRLHDHRAGFRQVGFWLAGHTLPADTITDAFCWSHYYAGRLFLEGKSIDPPPGYRPREFIVLDDERNSHPRLPEYQAARERAARGELVYHWSGKRHGKSAEVRVYMVQN